MLYTLALSSVKTKLVLRSRPRSASSMSAEGVAERVLRRPASCVAACQLSLIQREKKLIRCGEGGPGEERSGRAGKKQKDKRHSRRSSSRPASRTHPAHPAPMVTASLGWATCCRRLARRCWLRSRVLPFLLCVCFYFPFACQKVCRAFSFNATGRVYGRGVRTSVYGTRAGRERRTVLLLAGIVVDCVATSVAEQMRGRFWGGGVAYPSPLLSWARVIWQRQAS